MFCVQNESPCAQRPFVTVCLALYINPNTSRTSYTTKSCFGCDRKNAQTMKTGVPLTISSKIYDTPKRYPATLFVAVRCYTRLFILSCRRQGVYYEGAGDEGPSPFALRSA